MDCEHCENLTRREFLQGSLALTTLRVALPAWMPRLAFAPQGVAPRGDTLVCVFMRGGADGLNIVVPHGESRYYDLRPDLAIPAPKPDDDASAVDLDGFFGLHPSLRSLKGAWDARELAIVHAVGSPDPTHSHFDAMDFMERGTPGQKHIPTGWLGRHLAITASENDSPFRAVGFGSMLQSSLRGPIPATALQSIEAFHLQGREDQIAQFQRSLASLYADDDAVSLAGVEAFDAIDLLKNANPTQYQPSNDAAYPEGEFGLALMQVAQLIKSEVGLEVACVDIGGWDTHAAQGSTEGQLPNLLKGFGDALAAFHADLRDRMRNVTVVTMSEFGRRAAANASGGTDHGHGNFMFVIGGGLNGGEVYGEWPTLAGERLYGPGDLDITTDFRDVLGEIIQKRMLNDALSDVFPNYTDWNMRSILKPRA